MELVLLSQDRTKRGFYGCRLLIDMFVRDIPFMGSRRKFIPHRLWDRLVTIFFLVYDCLYLPAVTSESAHCRKVNMVVKIIVYFKMNHFECETWGQRVNLLNFVMRKVEFIFSCFNDIECLPDGGCFLDETGV